MNEETIRLNNQSKLRPTLKIYKPPVARVKGNDDDDSSSSLPSSNDYNNQINQKLIKMSSHVNSNDNFVYGAVNGTTHPNLISVQIPIKSALKRSKSFGAHSADGYLRLLNGLLETEISMEHQNLVRRALENPNSLVMTQLMEVVRVICNKAVEKSSNAHAVARMCLTIIDKERGSKMFLESLMNCCREWFNERDKLLRSTTKKWTAYLAFLTELYLNLRSKHRRVKLNLSSNNPTRLKDENEGDSDDGSGSSSGQIQSSLIIKQSRVLAILLFESCKTILTSLNTSSCVTLDIECLQSILRSVGRFMEEDYKQRMDQLMYLLRTAFINANQIKMSSMSQKSLMEIIELRASKWQLNQSQQLYYFPYTRFDSLFD